jgi:hypothetical protein
MTLSEARGLIVEKTGLQGTPALGGVAFLGDTYLNANECRLVAEAEARCPVFVFDHNATDAEVGQQGTAIR